MSLRALHAITRLTLAASPRKAAARWNSPTLAR